MYIILLGDRGGRGRGDRGGRGRGGSSDRGRPDRHQGGKSRGPEYFHDPAADEEHVAVEDNKENKPK